MPRLLGEIVEAVADLLGHRQELVLAVEVKSLRSTKSEVNAFGNQQVIYMCVYVCMHMWICMYVCMYAWVQDTLTLRCLHHTHTQRGSWS